MKNRESSHEDHDFTPEQRQAFLEEIRLLNDQPLPWKDMEALELKNPETGTIVVICPNVALKQCLVAVNQAPIHLLEKIHLPQVGIMVQIERKKNPEEVGLRLGSGLRYRILNKKKQTISAGRLDFSGSFQTPMKNGMPNEGETFFIQFLPASEQDSDQILLAKYTAEFNHTSN